jgi:hypothetical protein
MLAQVTLPGGNWKKRVTTTVLMGTGLGKPGMHCQYHSFR